MCSCMNGMKKRKKVAGFGDMQNTLIGEVIPAAAGILVGNVLSKQLTFLASNPTTGALVKVAGGLFLAGQRGFLGGMGVGIAAEGAAAVLLPSLKSAGIALLPPGVPARQLAGFPMTEGPNPVRVSI